MIEEQMITLTISMRQYQLEQEKIRALETIRTKKVEVNILEDCETCEEYNNFIKHRVWFQENYTITQKEFELLKKVLL